MKLASMIVFVLLVSFGVEAKDISQKQAIAKVMKHNPGKVLSVKTKQSKKAPIHAVKVLTKKGRVKTVKVNGKTGAIIKD